jgi:hypothetical protein
MSTVMNKDEIRRLVDQMPDEATIDDLIYRLYVIECVEQGLEAAKQDRVVDVRDVRKKYGLPA